MMFSFWYCTFSALIQEKLLLCWRASNDFMISAKVAAIGCMLHTTNVLFVLFVFQVSNLRLQGLAFRGVMAWWCDFGSSQNGKGFSNSLALARCRAVAGSRV